MFGDLGWAVKLIEKIARAKRLPKDTPQRVHLLNTVQDEVMQRIWGTETGRKKSNAAKAVEEVD
jgi:hypothetical protein